MATKRAPYRLGRRADGQSQRRKRIIEAAEAVFHEKGFKAARLREIAERAGVGTGTLFLYAPDKPGLLLLIHNEHLHECIEKGFATLDRSQSLIDQIVHIFSEQYRYLGKDPRLSLQAAQGATFYLTRDRTIPKDEVADYLDRRASLRKRIAELVVAEQARGRVDPRIDPSDVVEVSMSIYVHEVREWLVAIDLKRSKPDVALGLAQLRRRLAFALSRTG